MENNNKKIITVSFLLAGVLAAVVVSVLVETLAATFGAVAKYYAMDWVKHGVPVVVGLVTFSLLQFNSNVVIWADEVVVEIKKVVWPSRRDTTAMTIVTVVMLLVASFILGFFDFVSAGVVKAIIN